MVVQRSAAGRDACPRILLGREHAMLINNHYFWSFLLNWSAFLMVRAHDLDQRSGYRSRTKRKALNPLGRANDIGRPGQTGVPGKSSTRSKPTGRIGRLDYLVFYVSILIRKRRCQI